MLAALEQAHDIRMGERGDNLALALQPLAGRRIGGLLREENLHRGGCAIVHVHSAVDLAHAAGADALEQLVGADLLRRLADDLHQRQADLRQQQPMIPLDAELGRGFPRGFPARQDALGHQASYRRVDARRRS